MQLLIIIGVTVGAALSVNLGLERGFKILVGRTRTTLDDRIIAELRLPLVVTILLIGVNVGVEEIKYLAQYKSQIENSILSLLTIIWGLKVVTIGILLIQRFGEKLGYASHFLLLCSNITKVVVWTVAGLIILSVWGINITPLLASAGIAGVVLGLGAQETLSNIFSGVAIILDKPYKLHDYIVVQGVGETGQLRGEVLNIGMRSTQIRTRDNVYLTIPNAIMARSVIVNETGTDVDLRVRVKVGVAYGTDLQKVEQVMLKSIWEVEEGRGNILGFSEGDLQAADGKEPRVRFREFGESALIYEILVWIRNPELKGQMTHFISKAVLEAFRREGITIPFPQRDVRLKKE